MKTIVEMTSVHARHDVRIARKISRSLARDGFTVKLIVADGKGAEKVELANGKHYHVLDVGKKSQSRTLRFILNSSAVFLAACRARAHIVHFHDPELLPWGILLRLLGKKVIYDVHEELPAVIKQKFWLPKIIRLPLAIFFDYFERFASLFFHKISVATEKIGRRFPPKKTLIIQNFPDLNEFSTALPYSHRQKRIAYLGSLSRIRGISELCQAAKLIKNSNAQIELAGEFNEKTFAEKIQRNKAKNIKFHGYLQRPQAVKFLQNSVCGMATLLPAPNHISSQPNKLFEYMAAELPIIASDFPLWREFIKDNDCGLLVNPTKVNEIATAIDFILANPAKAKKMGENGKRAVEEKYNWQLEYPQLRTAIEKLL